MSNEVIKVNAEFNSKKNILSISAELPSDSQYALRVFRDEHKASEIMYRSTRLLNLEHKKEGFECEASEIIVGKEFELKAIRTNLVVAAGEVVDVTPAEQNEGTVDAAQN